MTTRSENPFKLNFWFGTVDPRPFAIFRILLGLTVLHDLVDFTRDLRAFITDEGMLPRGAVRDWYAWTAFDLVGGVPAVSALYLAGVLAVVAFTLGWRTRVATVASWLFLISLHHRNYYVTDGGDDLVRILFFYAMFADLGAAYGLDAVRNPSRVTDIPAFVPRLLQLHVAVLYFCASRLKFRRGWLHDNVIFAALQLDGFARPPGAWLLGFPRLCRLVTKAVWAMEGLFAFAAFAPFWRQRTRALAIALGVAIQGGILLTMRVGVFTEAMLAAMSLWLQPEWIDRAEAWVRGRRSLPADARPTRLVVGRPWENVVAILLGVQFVFAVWDLFIGRRFPLPNLVRDERDLIGIVQPAGLFDVVYDIPRWSAPGVLADGTPVDVLAVVAPGAEPRGPALSFSRWNKFTFKEREHPFLFPQLGAYLCRGYEERVPGAKLASFTLVDDATPPRGEDGAPVAPRHREMWHWTCGTGRVELLADP